MALYDLVETRFGIFDHIANGQRRPLSTVAMHPAEDFTAGSLLERCIRTYVRKNIQDIFKLNVIEFMDLPMDWIDILVTIADEEQARKKGSMDQIESEVKKMTE